MCTRSSKSSNDCILGDSEPLGSFCMFRLLRRFTQILPSPIPAEMGGERWRATPSCCIQSKNNASLVFTLFCISHTYPNRSRSRLQRLFSSHCVYSFLVAHLLSLVAACSAHIPHTSCTPGPKSVDTAALASSPLPIPLSFRGSCPSTHTHTIQMRVGVHKASLTPYHVPS
jgi:hypothetical protein